MDSVGLASGRTCCATASCLAAAISRSIRMGVSTVTNAVLSCSSRRSVWSLASGSSARRTRELSDDVACAPIIPSKSQRTHGQSLMPRQRMGAPRVSSTRARGTGSQVARFREYVSVEITPSFRTTDPSSLKTGTVRGATAFEKSVTTFTSWLMSRRSEAERKSSSNTVSRQHERTAVQPTLVRLW